MGMRGRKRKDRRKKAANHGKRPPHQRLNMGKPREP